MEIEENRGSVIQKFYRGTNIFITGGTGFMGKVLVEKLLRSCPNINSIYLLVRSKKGKDKETRIKELFEEPMFGRLRSEQPEFKDKVIAIGGDCAEKDLGLSPHDRQQLVDSLDVIFNLAATVRFDEHLRRGIYINVRATLHLMQLCKECVNLKVLIHLSTVYSHSYQQCIEEVFYDPPMTAEHAIKLTECLNDDTLTNITPKLLGQWCNTYTFTKSIAEHTVKTSNLSCPVVIFKPSIVLSSAQEPVPGWIDKPFGPILAYIHTSMGLIRVSEADKHFVTSLVPCDMSINAVIASAWDAHQRGRSENKDVSVYNYVSTCENPITWGQTFAYVIKYSSKVPFDNAIWVPIMLLCKWHLLYKFLMFFLHIVPAVIMDILLFCTGRETKMMKFYKKWHWYHDIVVYFSKNEWKFENENVRKMWINISDEDKNIFKFDIRDLNWDEYFYKSMEGYRKYILKQDPKDLPKAMKQRQRHSQIGTSTETALLKEKLICCCKSA
ncbi:fatty acyl-CoA reductase wat-like isoform X2 [Periplaneta americana]|uniref:fatty acyl-CoA reductase wat-like isoform X2 n=1 Tax=Periplaneta americana TaxID=6978 RepID=UPI0037E998A3